MDHHLADPFKAAQGWQKQPQPHNMNRNNPPLFQLQTTHHNPSTMNELDVLRIRTIELETELRLTKDQLLHAQSGTRYLVNCFANQGSRHVGSEIRDDHFLLDQRNRQLETEVHRLRGQVLLQSRNRTRHDTPQDPVFGVEAVDWWRSKARELGEEVAELKGQRASLLNDVLRLLKEDANDYSFRFDDGDPAIYKPLEHFRDKVAALEKKQASFTDVDLLGESQGQQALSMDREAEKGGHNVSFDDGALLPAKKPSIYIRQSDMALLDLSPTEQAKYERRAPHQIAHETTIHDYQQPVPEPSKRPATPELHSVPPLDHGPITPPYDRRERRQNRLPRPFAPWEHSHLMSNATFIEEMESEEYLAFFESLEGDVRRFAGRHTKEDWKSYYEVTVRPMFLQKMAQRGATAAWAEKVSVSAAEKVEVIPSIEPKVDTKARVVVEAGTASGRDREDETDDGTPAEPEPPKEVAKAEEHRPNFPSLEASQCAVTESKAKNAETIIAAEKNDSTRTVETGLAHGSAAPHQRAAMTLPTAPTLGPFSPLAQETPSHGLAPLPGLAGGWPQPVSRREPRAVRPGAVVTSEKDPGTWSYLFGNTIESRPGKSFVLCKNERLFRTVVINGVPVGITLAEVLELLRGGKIVGARFIDTAGLKSAPPITTNTVLVEFVGSQRAKAFVEHCEKNPMRLGSGDDGEEVRLDVQLIPTQTVPLPPALHADLARPEGALTRVLFVIFTDKATAPAPEALAREITSFADKCYYFVVPKRPLRITVEEDGMLLFEYADVRQAAAAWNAVAAMEWKLGEVSKGFAADPCGRSFERVEEEDEGKEEKESSSKEKQGDAGVDGQHPSAEVEAEEEAKWKEG